MTEQELVERLRAYADDDHERLCEGRNYDCTCGYDERRDPLLAEAADAIERLVRERDEWEAACDSNTALGAEMAETWKARASSAEAQLAAAEAQRDKLKEVLEPLVRLTDGIPSDADWSGAEDFRRAREALASIEQEKPDV